MKLPAANNLYTQLTLSHFLVAIVSISLISVFAGQSIITSSEEQVEHHLEDLAFTASNLLEDPLEDFLENETSIAEVHNAINHLFVDEVEVLYTLYLVDGTPIFRSDGTQPAQANTRTTPEVFIALSSEIGEGDLIRANEEGIDTFYVAVRIQHEDEIFGILRLETPLDIALTFTSMQRLLSLLLLSATLVALGVSVVGWRLARNLARPIEELTAVSERLHSGDLTARATPTGPQELHLLAETFNSMANRVERHMSELRVFVANASHELRTPLTSVKLRTEALQAGAINDPEVAGRFLSEIEHEVDRLGGMVNDLLDLSRLEAGMESSQREQVDIRMLVKEVGDTFTVRAERKDIQISVISDSNFPEILVNEEQLRRVLTNLIDNALKNLTQGGKVTSTVQFKEAENAIRITITDTGRGIADRHLPHIFERFYRVESTLPHEQRLPGSGLGLAISKSIIELHKGKISVESELGKGTTFEIMLPIF